MCYKTCIFPLVTLINAKAPRALIETPTMLYMAQSMLEHTIAALEKMLEMPDILPEAAVEFIKGRTNLELFRTASSIKLTDAYWHHVREVTLLAAALIKENCAVRQSETDFARAVIDDLKSRV